MKVLRFVLASAAGLLAAAASAHAQSARTELPPYAPLWSGFYIGAAFGGGVAENRVTSTGTTGLNVDSAANQGILASIYGGVDYQVLPQALVGALVEGTWSNMTGSASTFIPGVSSASLNRQLNLGWSALVRAGVLPSPSTLLYALGGYTGQNIHTNGTASAAGNVASFTRDQYFNGWTIGTGFETMLGSGWSTKLEYRYSQFESKTAPGTTFAITPSTHAIRAGLTYRFGGFAGTGSQDEASRAALHTNWTGIYVGAGGGASATVNHLGAFVNGASATIDEGGQNLLGTVFGGYDWQVADQAVLGFLGDVTWAGPQSTSSLFSGGSSIIITERTRMSWSALGRVGFLPTPSTLLYAAGGYTGEYITTNANATIGGVNAALQQDDVVNGWTVGPGIETVITGSWSTRLEYRYSQFEQKTVAGGATVQPIMHTIRAGLSYKFGPGPAK